MKFKGAMAKRGKKLEGVTISTAEPVKLNDLAIYSPLHNSRYDYSDIRDGKTREKLMSYELEIQEVQSKSASRIGQILTEVRDNYEGVFYKWVEGIGLGNRTAQKLIKRYRYSLNLNERERFIFDKLPVSLTYELSTKDVPLSILDQVFKGDITTRKMFKIKMDAYNYFNQRDDILDVIPEEVKPPQIDFKSLPPEEGTNDTSEEEEREEREAQAPLSPKKEPKEVVDEVENKLIDLNAKIESKKSQIKKISVSLYKMKMELTQLEETREAVLKSRGKNG